MSKLASLASGIGWGTVSIVTVTVFQLVFMAVMARLLDPADFGLVAIANVALRFYSYFSKMGIGPALIQKKTLSDGDIRAALALSLGISIFFFLLAYFSADLVELFFGMKSLALVMQVLAVNFIVFGFSAVPLGLIRRKKAFKALAIIEIISYVFGYGVIGLGSAYYGYGVWALVAAFISQTFLQAVIGYLIIRHPLSLLHTKEERNHLIGYGGRYSIIGFIEFLTSNIDSLIVGKLFGAIPAGYYSRSLLLANLPVQQPTKVLTQVLFPIMSSMSDQHDKQSISVQLSALFVGSYAFAVGIGISVAAPDIVLVLLGNKWLDSIPVLQILAYSVGPIYMSNVMGVTLDSMGKLSAKLRVQLCVFIFLAVILFYAAPTGDIANVAMAVVAAFWVRLLIMGWVLAYILKISFLNILKTVLTVTTITIFTGYMIFMVSHLAPEEYFKAIPAEYAFDLPVGYAAIIRLFFEIIFGLYGLFVGSWFSLFFISKHPAVLYLADRMPRVKKMICLNRFC